VAVVWLVGGLGCVDAGGLSVLRSFEVFWHEASGS
jgi:hypothetical protein